MGIIYRERMYVYMHSTRIYIYINIIYTIYSIFIIWRAAHARRHAAIVRELASTNNPALTAALMRWWIINGQLLSYVCTVDITGVLPVQGSVRLDRDRRRRHRIYVQQSKGFPEKHRPQKGKLPPYVLYCCTSMKAGKYGLVIAKPFSFGVVWCRPRS